MEILCPRSNEEIQELNDSYKSCKIQQIFVYLIILQIAGLWLALCRHAIEITPHYNILRRLAIEITPHYIAVLLTCNIEKLITSLYNDFLPSCIEITPHYNGGGGGVAAMQLKTPHYNVFAVAQLKSPLIITFLPPCN